MTLNLAGALLAGTVWLLAAVLAWPAGHPTAAVVLLAVQAGCYLLIAVLERAAGRPTISVRVRRGNAR
jgi:hypothetical protein